MAGKWMELKIIILSEVSQVQKSKSNMFLSHVEYRPNTNMEISWKSGHTKGRLHTRGVR
jgi:hypothetical protein